ncbi:MAG: hypothetical protein ACREHF_04520 [Rhizomicrobium sp.]
MQQRTAYPVGLNIEDDFCKAMRSIGAVRPVEIDPNCQDHKYNADIVFKERGIIAEIKTLVNDSRAAKDFGKRYSALYAKWTAKGLVPSQSGPTLKLDTSKLPEACSHELLRLATRPAKQHAESANAQIKGLKQTLGMQDAKGLLVLCNTGNPFLAPEIIGYGLHHAMPHARYRSIDWMIFMTHKLPVRVSGVSEPADVFARVLRDGFPPMPSDLFGGISAAWFHYLAKKTGEPVKAYASDDPDGLFDVKHLSS